MGSKTRIIMRREKQILQQLRIKWKHKKAALVWINRRSLFMLSFITKYPARRASDASCRILIMFWAVYKFQGYKRVQV